MRKTLTALLLPLALGAHAQSESGLWLGADASYGISSKFSANVEIGTRLEGGFSNFSRYDAALGLQFKPLRWLRLGAGYDFIRDYSGADSPLEVVYKKDPQSGEIRYDSDGNPVVSGYNASLDYWRTKHRFYFDLGEKWKVGRFGFALRERYQLTRYTAVEGCGLRYRDELDAPPAPGYTPPCPEGVPAGVAPFVGPMYDADGEPYWYGLTGVRDKKAKTRHYLRTRLAIDYNIRHCPFTPFASYELANDLGDAFSIVRHRVSAGFDWNLTRNKQHALSLAYIYQHGAQEEVGNADLHVLSLGYKFSFDSPRLKAQKAARKKGKKD